MVGIGGDEDFHFLANAGLLLTVVMAFPVFLARVLRRWTIVQRNSNSHARPVSLASYLTLMTIFGVTFTTMKFFPRAQIAGDQEGVAAYLLVFSGPLIVVGCLHLWMIPNILGPRGRRSISWKQWLLLAAMVTIGSVSSIVGFAVFLFYTRVLNGNEVAQVSAMPIALIISAAFFNAAGCYWLRLLDYELRTASITRRGSAGSR